MKGLQARLMSSTMGTSCSLREQTELLMPSADIPDGWVTVIQPSRDSMLSKKEETSLAVDGGILACKISVSSGHST
jgi:hypothetical protein